MRAPRLVLDVSNNRTIDAATLRLSGAVALIAKETEGRSFRDGTAARHRAAARACRIPFGGYLFLHVVDPRGEVRAFREYAQLARGDLHPVIDTEVSDGHTMAQVADAVDEAAREFEANGYRPIVYASASFWLALHRERPTLRRLRVWEAQYPGRFTRWFPGLARRRIRLQHGASVVLWQWTDSYRVGAVSYDASRLLVPLDRLTI